LGTLGCWVDVLVAEIQKEFVLEKDSCEQVSWASFPTTRMCQRECSGDEPFGESSFWMEAPFDRLLWEEPSQ